MPLLAPERHVACDCPTALQLPLGLTEVSDQVSIYTCVGCGAITATRPICHELRPHDVRVVARETLALPNDAIDWLGEWYRLVPVGESYMTRHRHLACSDPHQLATENRSAWRVQSKWRLGQRVRAEPCPSAPPSLPVFLRAYEVLWEILADAEVIPFDELLLRMRWEGVLAAVVANLVIEHDPEASAVCAAMRRGNAPLQHAVMAVLTHWRPAPIAAVAALLEVLESVSLARSIDSRHVLAAHAEAINVLGHLSALDLTEGGALCRASLPQARQRIGKRDYVLVDAISKLEARLMQRGS